MPIKLPVAAQCTDWYQCYATQVNKEENFSVTSMIHESDYSYFDLHSKTNLHAVIFLPSAPGQHLGTAADRLLWSRTGKPGKYGADSSPMQQGRPASLLLPMPEEHQHWDEGRCQQSSRLHQPWVRISLGEPSTAVFQILPISPGISLSVPHTHSLLLSFFPVGRRHLIGLVMYYCDTFAFEVQSGF